MSTATVNVTLGEALPEAQLHLQSGSGLTNALVALVPLAALLYLIRQWALPKPIPGIPYKPDSVKSMLGDFQAIGKYLASANVTYFDWIEKQAKDLNSPIIQVFPRPFGKPTVVVSDFNEAQDILMRRGKEFDRSYVSAEIFTGIIPDHHIVHKTDSAWKSQRRLLQDLMSPGFLEGVAAPVLYQTVSDFVRMWELKAQAAQRRPFKASEDIYYTALDSVHGFAFGQDFKHNANQPTLEYLERTVSEATNAPDNGGSIDEPIDFPRQEMDVVIKSFLRIIDMFAEVQGSPIAKLKWPILNRLPSFVKAKEIRQETIRKEIQGALERTETHPDPKTVRSAVDHMVRRELILAEKEGRPANCFSPAIFDEIFGFVVAGHDTTSTTISWGVKFLADNPRAQDRLRAAMQEGFSAAKEEGRPPTVHEIISTNIPYLDASQEEILRCAGTSQTTDREAMMDTEILGHKIPKGTIVIMPIDGASVKTPAFNIEESSRHRSSQEAIKSGRARRYWDAADVSEFKPERWLSENGEFDATSGPAMAFSLGTRSCFGKRLANIQLRMLLTLIVWNFELQKCPEKLSGYGHKMGLTTEPMDCYVRLRKIEL
ncbi:hypothetical protein KVR01_006213 [Diaporthe batatas]|uniref:uncharacterized protein n=1 Tax=Diaporthe batatas TaxID=748121 RepID=UPI001D056D85|nr:uncharacterized protein KVR01_006213 [Diaporthe batatas]KAG8164295.1 hypothetical protein KVR01_006213 [Diaporthe batatas]